jgi:hypothetical protein
MGQRVKPFLALLVGLAVLGLNVLMLIAGGRFFPFGTILGCALVGAALFGIVVGEPEDAYGYRPMWFKVGIAASAIVGLLVALGLNLFLATGN